MADKLIVRDFGPIKNAELDIKKTTLLIGPQGSGKSTLAKLVALASNNSWRNIIGNDSDLHYILSDYQLLDYASSNSYFEILGRETVTEFSKGGFHTSLRDTYPGKSEILEYQSRLASSGLRYSDVVIEFVSKVSRPIYIPAERTLFSTIARIIFSLTANKIPIPQSISDFGNKFESAKEVINEFQTIVEGVKYTVVNGRDMVSSNGINIPLSDSASGFQALIPMQLVVESFSKEPIIEFIVEEPELNLYPTTQKKLVYYLADKCTKQENQLLLTTHSPYVLSSLNNLLFAFKVAQKYPEQADEIANIIPRESWLNPDEFAAYFVADGTVRSIINPKTGLISENELDGVSEDIGDEFDALMEIYSEKANEGSY
jgi:predicted ATPase